MSCSTSFKIFFNQEIHRVGIPSDAPTLVQLHDYIKSIFSAQVKGADTVRIHYIDEDGDKITVSSEEEWREALSTMKDVSPKKIYVSTDKSKLRPQQRQQQQPRGRKDLGPRRNIAQPNKIDKAVSALADGVEIDFESFGNDLVKLPHVLQMRAYLFLESKEYDKAHNLLKAAVRLNPHSSVDLYNLACVYALTGKHLESCTYLQKSVESGYKDLKHILSDLDLDSIRKMSEYEEVIQGLRMNCPTRFMSQGREEESEETIKTGESSAPEVPEVDEVEEKLEEKFEEKYKEQLDLLKELGFSDKQMNLELLEEEDGNINAVVDLLLNLTL